MFSLEQPDRSNVRGLNGNVKKIEPKGWRKQRVSKIDMKKLEEDVINNPDAYQYERAKRLKVSQAAVHFGLKRLGVTYKKNVRTSKSK